MEKSKLEKSKYVSSWIPPKIDKNSYRTGLMVNNSLTFDGKLVSCSLFSINLVGRIYSIRRKNH